MAKKLYLTSLAPVHIGSGKSLEPFDYVIMDDILYRLDTDKIFRELYDKNPAAADLVMQWIEQTSTELDKVGNDNKKQSEIRKRFTLLNYIRNYIKDAALANSIQEQIKQQKDFILYSAEYVADKKGKKKELRECVKTATNEVYIPGSSIKGSIRTALLAYAVQRLPEARKKVIVNQLLNTLQQKDSKEKYFADVLEKEIFFCVDERNSPDAKYDLMKVIKISDSSSKPATTCLRVSPIDLYLKTGDEPQGQTPMVEAIKPGEVFEVTISIDTEFLRTASKLLLNNDERFGKTEWKGITEKFQRLFDFDLHTAHNIPAGELENNIVEKILSAVKEFSLKVKKHEQQWAEIVAKNSKSKLHSAATRMINQYNVLPDDAFKLGYASGFPATTLFLLMKDDPLFSALEKALMKKFRIGMPKDKNKVGKTAKELNLEKFPASRRFETLSEVHVTPLGWVILSTTPLERTVVEQKQDTRTEPVALKPPAGAVEAVVVEVLGPKVLKVQLRGGKYDQQIHTLGGNHFANLGIVQGSVLYVSIAEQKGKLQSLKFIRKVS